MIKLFKKPLFWTNVAAFTVTGLVVASVAFGWTNPSATPPTVGGALKVDSATGNVGIGLDTGVSASQKLDVKGYVKGQTGLCISDNCRTSWPSGIGGSGTSGKLSKFTGATTIGDSIITETAGGNIGVNITSPTEKFEVSGGKIKSSGAGSGFCIGSNCITGWGPFTANKIPKAVTATTLGDSAITDNAGNIGIGIATPARALHVGVVGFRITSGALPSFPATGDIAIDSAASNKLKWYDGTKWQTATAAVPNYDVSCSKSVAGSSTGGTVSASCSMTCDVNYAISSVKSLEAPSDSITYSGSVTATCSDVGYIGAGTSVSCTGTCVRTAP